MGFTRLTSYQKVDLSVLVIMATLVAVYFIDAYRASTHAYNLIFVAPISILVLLLCMFEFIAQLSGKSQPSEKLQTMKSVLPAIGLFTFYVASLELLGFDIGSVIFVSAFLWLHGERRIPWVMGYGIAFGILVALFFSNMLPYPMPMLLLPTEY